MRKTALLLAVLLLAPPAFATSRTKQGAVTPPSYPTRAFFWFPFRFMVR